MKKKKLTALLTAVAMMTGILSGCGSKGAESAPAEKTPAADEASSEQESAGGENGGTAAAGDAQPITIWYYWENEGHQATLDQLIQEYN